ncbi:uncharacterized protein [Arachis hypogaea]|uniref:uncharacterized protein n=1 Tax=Arachis hypogaea TaxID=3818 RepID=UPI003B223ADA
MDLFERTTDLRHHLINFKSRIYLADAFDVTRYKAFPTTLTKAVIEWFDSLPSRREITKSSRKRYLKKVYQVVEDCGIPDLPTISFTKEDAQRVTPGYNDPVVITMILANANLHRILVDQGSSVDILFKSTFDKFGLEEKELKAYMDNLFGLGDTPIQPLDFILLHMTFGKDMKSRTLSINYIIVDVASAYNALIGQITLNRLVAIVSTLHLCMKFSTAEGITTVKGDKKLARKMLQ